MTTRLNGVTNTSGRAFSAVSAPQLFIAKFSERRCRGDWRRFCGRGDPLLALHGQPALRAASSARRNPRSGPLLALHGQPALRAASSARRNPRSGPLLALHGQPALRAASSARRNPRSAPPRSVLCTTMVAARFAKSLRERPRGPLPHSTPERVEERLSSPHLRRMAPTIDAHHAEINVHLSLTRRIISA